MKFINKTIKLFVISILVLAMLVSALPVFAENDKESSNKEDSLLVTEADDVYYMLDYLNDVENIYTKNKYPIDLSALEIADANGNVLDLADKLKNGIGDKENTTFLWDKSVESLSFSVDVKEKGLYFIELDYYLTGGKGSNAVRSLTLDGKQPYDEASNITFVSEWTDDGNVTINSIGDEVRPDIVMLQNWRKTTLRDSSAYYATPLLFFLEEGVHTFSLGYTKEEMAIDDIAIVGYQKPVTYKELESTYNKDSQIKEQYVFQSEDTAVSRSDATIRVESNSDPATTPNKYGYKVFNAIGGSRWKKSNQSISFEFYVKESGYYNLGFRVSQTWNDGLPSYRTIELDGKIPCEELMYYRFSYDRKWQTVVLGGNDNPYKFWLDEGKHTITMSVVLGDYTTIVQNVYRQMITISDMTLDITRLTGSDPDPNYDYRFFKYIEGLEDKFKSVIKELTACEESLLEISGKDTSMTNNFKSIIRQFTDMLNNPFSIAKRYDQITQAQTNLGTYYLSLQQQPLLIDEYYVSADGQIIEHRESNFWQRLWGTAVNFIISFSKDYDNIAGSISGDVDIKETLNIWIARGTEWSEIIKSLADETFTPETGILVNMNVVPSSQLNSGSANALLLSIVSGTNPDIALSVASSSPVEFAIRDAVEDLRQFPNYDEVFSRFIPSITIPYEYNDGVYAIPETMSFTALFYRKDIVSKYKIPLPNTREELYDKVLPLLFENGMQYYQTQDFTQFLFQRGGEYYTENGRFSALDSNEAYVAFKEYTEMFTHYDSPVSANFFNRFRSGEMPMGIGNYGLYVQLCTAAPELIGKWEIAPIPGTLNADGKVDRSNGGLAGECDIILKTNDESKKQAAWKFLDWWTSNATQEAYASEVESLLGVEARWNTANVEVFENLSWNDGDIEVFHEMWNWANESPVVLGGYYTGRYLGNAFTSVVVSGNTSVRDALEDAVDAINKELKVKQEEYGVFYDEE